MAASNAWRQTFVDRAVLYACVAAGGVVGGTARYLAGLAEPAPIGSAFPWTTLCVNVIGSFAIGFYAAITGPQGPISAGQRQRQFVMTGICGGFTTFSSFALETVQTADAGHLGLAATNVVLSLGCCAAAVCLGHLSASLLPSNGPRRTQPKLYD